MEYSLKKGLLKGAIGVLTSAVFVITMTSFADVSLWSLLEMYLKPVLGAMTVAGLFTFVINLLKQKIQN